jgi:hypothetical protein
MAPPQTPSPTGPAVRWPVRLAWGLTVPGLAVIVWLDRLILQDAIAELYPMLLALLTAAMVGTVLTSRQPRHPVGWLLLVFGFSGVVAVALDLYAHYALRFRPGEVPAGGAAAMVAAEEDAIGIDRDPPHGIAQGRLVHATAIIDDADVGHWPRQCQAYPDISCASGDAVVDDVG